VPYYLVPRAQADVSTKLDDHDLEGTDPSTIAR
jgi:hypothetical protein